MKYLYHKRQQYECIECGFRQKIWNYEVSKTRCSCGGKGLKNWKLIEEEKSTT